MLVGLNNNIGYQVRTYDPDMMYVRNYSTYNQLKRTKKYNPDDLHRQEISLDIVNHDGVQQGGGGAKLKRGGGIISDTIKMFQQGIKVVGNIYDSEPMNNIRNAWGKTMNNNPNWRPGYAGERHMIDTSTGVTYNYLGPHTRLQSRLEREDPPLDGPQGLDAVARVHDIEYNQARNSQEIRDADIKFVSAMDAAKGDSKAKFLAKNAIKAKMKLEDMGIAKAQDFTSLPNLVQDEKPNAMQIDDQKPAFAGKGKKDPAKKLKEKVLRLKKKKVGNWLHKI